MNRGLECGSPAEEVLVTVVSNDSLRDAAKQPVSAACDHYQGPSKIVDCERLSNSSGMRRAG